MKQTELEEKVEAAWQSMSDPLNKVLSDAVDEQVGEGTWTGDVDPAASLHYETAIKGVLRQLIQNSELVYTVIGLYTVNDQRFAETIAAVDADAAEERIREIHDQDDLVIAGVILGEHAMADAV